MGDMAFMLHLKNRDLKRRDRKSQLCALSNRHQKRWSSRSRYKSGESFIYWIIQEQNIVGGREKCFVLVFEFFTHNIFLVQGKNFLVKLICKNFIRSILKGNDTGAKKGEAPTPIRKMKKILIVPHMFLLENMKKILNPNSPLNIIFLKNKKICHFCSKIENCHF